MFEMNDGLPQRLSSTDRWHARPVKYWRGRWPELCENTPHFKIDEFKVSKETASNPYLKSVVRLPLTLFEAVVPVGVVSNTYALVQHHEVVRKCFEPIRKLGIDPETLDCELCLTELGESMALRVHLPEGFSYTPKDNHRVDLCLECFNSVEGSSRLIVRFTWLRLVCTNGLLIRETKVEVSDIHNQNIDLNKIVDFVDDGLCVVGEDVNRLNAWESHSVQLNQIEVWTNTILATEWGKKAACRVFHICLTGHDVDFTNPFARGEATEKPIVQTAKVPGASAPAENLYDVCQALAWVSNTYNSTEERLKHQSTISHMISRLRDMGRVTQCTT